MLHTAYAASCVTYLKMATFVDKKKVSVEGVEYTADHILVAVGGRPMFPDIPGKELCISR